MQHAALLALVSPAFGFGLAQALVEPANGFLLARYPGVASSGLSGLGDPAGLTWLAAGAVLAATLTAFVAPRLLKAGSASDGVVRAAAFCGSLVASCVLVAIVFWCATAQPTSPPMHDAAQALSHAGQCLRIALLFAQVLVAMTLGLLRNHIARDLPPSKYSVHGYAALH